MVAVHPRQQRYAARRGQRGHVPPHGVRGQGAAAGHTHRNRVRRFPATGDRPWIEVACVKDYPGTWAEYRVFDGGVLQVHRRISTPEALDWTEKTRHMFAGMYADYAFGALDERCFAMLPA